jgi:hypothetical protein
LALCANNPATGRTLHYRIPQSRCVGLEHAAHFVADPSETSQNFFFAASRPSRIIERPVMTIYLAGKNGHELNPG